MTENKQSGLDKIKDVWEKSISIAFGIVVGVLMVLLLIIVYLLYDYPEQPTEPYYQLQDDNQHDKRTP